MNLSKLFEKNEEKEFTTFPSTLETYAWYKPFLIIIIAAILSLVISSVIFKIAGVNVKAGGIERIIYSSITMIALIPGIYIGFKLLYKIPFSTQIAPIRKWNWGIYIKSFIITLIVYGVFQVVPLLVSGKPNITNTSIAVLILCLILPLVQGFAEEYLCRGLLMQTFGSWFKIPIVAIFLQAIIFSLLHPYKILAAIGVFCVGFVYGFITWYGQGLESASAMHAVNNMFAFLALGLGLQQTESPNEVFSFVMNLVLLVIPIIIIFVLDKKFNFFDS